MSKGRPRLYDAIIDRAKALYERGDTIREVVDVLQRETGGKISRATVHRMLKRAGVALRNRRSGI